MEVENDKMKSTGERIKALLNEKKMTQRQLAELSGATESAIEQNKNKMTNEEKAELIELLFRKD